MAMAVARSSVRVVVFPFPAQGHISPALHFCRQLASRGCCITFVNTAYNISSLRAQSLEEFEAVNIRLVAISDGLPDGECGTENLPRLCQATETMGQVLQEVLLDLLQEGNHWLPPVCIVTDVFLGWVQDVANKLDLPRFILFTPSAATLLLMLNLPSIIAKGLLPYYSKAKAGESELLDIPGLTRNMRINDVPSHLLQDPSAFMYGYFIRQTERIRDAAGILLNTFEELESDALNASRAEFPLNLSLFSLRPDIMCKLEETSLWHAMPVGPLVPSELFEGYKSSEGESAEDAKCLRWLDKQKASSVIYISFGSIAVLPNSQIYELALGLQASQRSFLWVLRPQDRSAAHEDVLPPGFQADTKARGLIVSWAPQLRVLSHPSTGVFFSHCGWNSALESICSGTPILSLPIFAEQKMNCRYLVDEIQIAIEVIKGEGGLVSRDEVQRVVRLVMGEEGEAMRTKARMMQSAAHRAIVSGGSSYGNLETFVEHMKAFQLSPLTRECLT